jgi:hypothetical protein
MRKDLELLSLILIEKKLLNIVSCSQLACLVMFLTFGIKPIIKVAGTKKEIFNLWSKFPGDNRVFSSFTSIFNFKMAAERLFTVPQPLQ